MAENIQKNNAKVQSPSFANAPEDEHRVRTEPRIRTMKSDVDELFHEKKETVISAIAKETLIEPKEAQKKDGAQTKKLNLLIVAVLSALFLIGSSGAYYYFFSSSSKKIAVPQKKQGILVPRPFFSMEKSRNIIVNTPDIGNFNNTLAIIRNDHERDGTIKRIVLIMRDGEENERVGLLKDFLNASGITLPQNLEETLINDINFFLYYQNDTSVHPGLIIPIVNELKAFRALVDHEAEFFTIWKNLYNEPSAKLGSVLAFEDITYRNIDIRRMQFAQKEDFGFYYAIFKSKKYLIIATSFEEIKIIIDRLFDAL
ncbi:MAG: hypothetical protein AAB362_02925 [Patescibacteria group bacterium]